ncbi:hypothetical protein BGZ65_005162 [Modicella reniformis]|uniref:Uncharacterized protein n=1 Tax=Modicella reniformis TaxID=1440133 RepID=A0A9P6MKU3_9FUNG|nr:hypothetical protein BGZ65_005162 [Modicella reniformis]
MVERKGQGISCASVENTQSRLAKHEGYDIAQPTEFFDQYDFYVLTILRMLKFGISVAGVADLRKLDTFLKSKDGNKSKTSLQDLAHLLRVYGRHVEAFDIQYDDDDDDVDSAIEAFAEPTQNGSGLREIVMENLARALGDKCIKNVASLIARSEVCELFIDLEDEEERVVILESIPWRHVRKLKVELSRENQVIMAMKVLAGSMEKMSESVQLEYFGLHSCP